MSYWLAGGTGLLSVFFLLASSVKLTGWQRQVFEIQLAFFTRYGLNRQVMWLVGLVELLGALLIWVDGWIGVAGALALALTSVGAIVCHLRFDRWQDGVPATVTLLLSGGIAYCQYLGLVG